jgi:large subunit ribosomal protein L24
MSKLSHVKKGDTVLVVSGNHRGSQGKVLGVIAKNQRVQVEGVHMVKKHVRRAQNASEGGIVEREGTIHISNLKVVSETSQN